MYIVTGGAGFIGSAFVWKLNREGIDDIVIVDNLGATEKWKNLVPLRYREYLHRDEFREYLIEDLIEWDIQCVIHMGACSSTTETDADFLMDNNYRYSRELAEYCLMKDIRFIHASSAATYGDGSQGFDDELSGLRSLRPLNMYGYTKHLFDLWAAENSLFDRITALKFFNVFGPNEYHKGDMKSVVCKAFDQISETGKLKLFQSHRGDFEHGEQMRDFIYVKDCVEIMWWLMTHPEVNGLFNVGTGQARTWNDLAQAIFSAMGREPEIEYIPMPETIRDKYQYFTQAEMNTMMQAGCPVSFSDLEGGVREYVQVYLEREKKHLEPDDRKGVTHA